MLVLELALPWYLVLLFAILRIWLIIDPISFTILSSGDDDDSIDDDDRNDNGNNYNDPMIMIPEKDNVNFE